jgi:flagellar basal body-associated protein FliL
MDLLLLLLLVVVVLALVGGIGGPRWIGRGPRRRVVDEVTYDDPVDPVEPARPRRIVEY